MEQLQQDGEEIERLRVQVLGTLATVYRLQGRYATAEPLYHQALVHAEQTLGPDDLDVAAAYNNLAVLYKAQGRYGDAAALYQRALAIFVQVHGPTHPSVVACRENDAQLLQAMQREG